MSEKRKTIEIDDAGTGDLVGDAFIGFHLLGTGRIIFKAVPVGLYNEVNLKENAPKKKILEIVKAGLKVLNYEPQDRILLCRGDCFDLVRRYFEEEGIPYEPSIIEGRLQDAVEGRLVAHLRKLGVTSRSLSTKSGAKRYFILLDWLTQDFYNREKFVKTGFKSWKKTWRERAIEKYNNRKNRRN